MSRWNEMKLDTRTAEDFRCEIAALARSYTPEWAFDPENPDVGSVIAMIFADQMQENVNRLNGVLEQYHRVFVNMLGISLLPSSPAAGVVVMGLLSPTMEGVQVPKGTKLMTEGPDSAGRQMIFETTDELYVTAARLTDVLEISGSSGRIFCRCGPLKAADPLERDDAEEKQSREQEKFPLFDFRRPGLEKNGLLLYHRSLFTAEGEQVFLRFAGEESAFDLARRFADPEQFHLYRHEEGLLKPIDQVTVEGDALCFSAGGEKLFLDGEEYGLIYLEAENPISEPLVLTEIALSAEGGPCRPDYLGGSDREADGGETFIFGHQIDLYDEFFIGSNTAFTKESARITLKFDLSFTEQEIGIPPEEEEFELKPIRRKPRGILKSQRYHTCADEIDIQYFNGVGWRSVSGLEGNKTLFSGSVSGHISLEFLCPQDWSDTSAGPFFGRLLRFRILRADNCYMMPCVHRLPILHNVTLAYSFGENWLSPDRVRTVCGTCVADRTAALRTRTPFPAFSPLPYEGNGLYLGFDRKFENGPVSLLVQIERSNRHSGIPLRCEYSTVNGFAPLKIIDHTGGFQHAGTIEFMPPANFSLWEVEGRRCCWLRLADASGECERTEMYHPQIELLKLNAVRVENIETRPEEEYYIEEVAPNMRFPLGADNILEAVVYVNEKRSLTAAEMRRMLAEEPERVRAEYDFLGEIREFFVRWDEVENFRSSRSGDRHYLLDRMIGAIQFGNGVHGKIPSERQDVAFTVILRCCCGAKGNLPADSITENADNLLYIDEIRNPAPTFGGSNIESVEHAYRRGADIVGSRGRLVSEWDYIRRAQSYSDAIDKASCVIGRDITGAERAGHVLILLLMKDCELGAPSFSRVRDSMREQLLQRCELTCRPEELEIAEPIYVEISTEVWVTLEQTEGAFEVQSKIQDALKEYLSPVSSGNRPGWEIGTLPREEKLAMLLHSLKLKGRLRHIVATGRYADSFGSHERGLNELQGNSMMIGMNGKHRIHLELSNKER